MANGLVPGVRRGGPGVAVCACLLSLVLAVVLAGCREAEPAKVVGPPPTRVVSLVPAVTEMLFAIGGGPRVVAVSSFDNWPKEAAALPKVGGLLDPDTERIISLRPDLVIVEGSQAEVMAKVQTAGIRTYSYKSGSLANVTKTMRELGTILGIESQASAAAGAIDQRLEAIRQRAEGRPRPKALLVFGREQGAMRAIDVSGGLGFLHDIVQLAGGDNVFGSERREWLRVSLETILVAAPDVVIELHYGYYLTPARLRQEMAVWDGLSTLPAVRRGRVHLLEGEKFVVPGPRIVDAAEEIAAVIHPAAAARKIR